MSTKPETRPLDDEESAAARDMAGLVIDILVAANASTSVGWNALAIVLATSIGAESKARGISLDETLGIAEVTGDIIKRNIVQNWDAFPSVQ